MADGLFSRSVSNASKITSGAASGAGKVSGGLFKGIGATSAVVFGTGIGAIKGFFSRPGAVVKTAGAVAVLGTIALVGRSLFKNKQDKALPPLEAEPMESLPAMPPVAAAPNTMMGLEPMPGAQAEKVLQSRNNGGAQLGK